MPLSASVAAAWVGSIRNAYSLVSETRREGTKRSGTVVPYASPGCATPRETWQNRTLPSHICHARATNSRRERPSLDATYCMVSSAPSAPLRSSPTLHETRRASYGNCLAHIPSRHLRSVTRSLFRSPRVYPSRSRSRVKCKRHRRMGTWIRTPCLCRNSVRGGRAARCDGSLIPRTTRSFR